MKKKKKGDMHRMDGCIAFLTRNRARQNGLVGSVGRYIIMGVGSYRRLAFLVSVVVCVMTMMLLVLMGFGVSSFFYCLLHMVTWSCLCLYPWEFVFKVVPFSCFTLSSSSPSRIVRNCDQPSIWPCFIPCLFVTFLLVLLSGAGEYDPKAWQVEGSCPDEGARCSEEFRYYPCFRSYTPSRRYNFLTSF